MGAKKQSWATLAHVAEQYLAPLWEYVDLSSLGCIPTTSVMASRYKEHYWSSWLAHSKESVLRILDKLNLFWYKDVNIFVCITISIQIKLQNLKYFVTHIYEIPRHIFTQMRQANTLSSNTLYLLLGKKLIHERPFYCRQCLFLMKNKETKK